MNSLFLVKITDFVYSKLRNLYSFPIISKFYYKFLLFRYEEKREILDYINSEEFKNETLNFVEDLNVNHYKYLYAHSQKVETLYSSTYACMIYSLFDEIKNFSKNKINNWSDYLNTFQAENGLYIDPKIENEAYFSEDWWGARHLTIQVATCLAELGKKPLYDFSFMEELYDEKKLILWLKSKDWNHNLEYVGNEIMNYGVLMQFSVLFFKNTKAKNALNVMKKWIRENVLEEFVASDSKKANSSDIQGIFHILTLYTYDKEIINNSQIILALLKTQNQFAGYGVSINSSACEDIDSIEPLHRYLKMSKTNLFSERIYASLKKSLKWVLLNRNKDGGFVFRRDEPFIYGHKLMASKINESSLFATWFRLLTLSHILDGMNYPTPFKRNSIPGFDF